MLGQVVSGKIYDKDDTVKGAKITNTTKQTSTYSTIKGDFYIKASVNDTLIISSLFHLKQAVIINSNYTKTKVVIELKKDINTLDVVLLTNKTEPKPFKSKAYTQNLGLQIKNDIKNNPHLYKPMASGNIDFVELSKLIRKLFKSKKTKKPLISATTYEQFDSLFANDKFFNNKLLENNLNISKKHKGLFFDYCDAKKLDSNLLKKENNFILLDSLVLFSQDFLKIIDNYNKSK
ncbi:hypothetical protein GCM10022291_25980 [Postechiella marina]|uniref:Uncharacterized protein n=1 Tax=Postechiella marina TaxID=943941 RepID=A0ABP8CDT3_9FLAO